MQNEKLLNYALDSLKKGISVIPVGKNKIPLIPWKIFQEKHATEEEVRGWFKTFDDPQIGFVTGKISNLLVIDIEKGGDPSFLPQNTTIVGTGGGGYHYYFKFEDGIMNKARIRPLIDWRGEGGYVVSPNSVSDKGGYKILQEAELLEFPKELFPEDKNIFDVPESGGGMRFAKRELQSYPGYGKGTRNDEMTRYIGYVLTQIHPSDWNNEAWPIIDQANRMNIPPLSQKELIATFESVMGIEKRNNPLGRGRSDFLPKTYPPQAVSEEDTPWFFEENDEIKHISEVAESQLINSDDIYPLQMVCFDEAIEGGVCPGDVIVIAGQPGHGKTTLCQDWTMSMIRGERKTKALWFSYEVLVRNVWKKFQGMGMTKEDLVFIPLRHTNGNVAWIEAKIKEGKEKFGVKTIFIDHLGFLLPKTNGVLGKNLSSNQSSFLTQIMRDLKTIAIKEEVIIFLPVHMKKPNYTTKRAAIEDITGTNGIAQESDLVFLIEREKNEDKEATELFTNVTRITLAKNRKTGQTAIGNFFFLDGRFSFDPSRAQAEKDFKELGEEKVEKEVVKITQEEIIEKEIEQEQEMEDIINEAWDINNND